MLHRVLKNLAPIAALAAGAALAGCNYSMNVGDSDGVPLTQLDLTGPAPTELVLAGPDRVIVTDGDTLDIDVSGDADAVELLRFTLEDGALGISRENGSWRDTGTAIVRVTMPSPRHVSIAGSGEVEAASLSGDKAEINLAGSGKLRIARVAARQLEANIAGSGSVDASGNAERFELNIMGSGNSRMPGLRAAEAEVSIAGSGNGEFASDGEVEANIAGSGTVVVHGRARCTVSAVGSGKLVCRDGTRTGDARAPESDGRSTAGE
ncbi:head GIN domain-containing protein [Qipengyuania spongiae]|uniref:DUF2807 domain-containing protein n=1 Tax=Qipengyuania spongiae TaxID=2909673 RepID=A0ABY5T063_9SPHN|nr:head GIN domain-containing protein [Qipengyuania spongiae]UVI39970.1 DUF2807 domain-containing protein [Qipengyuania spongiae]